MAEYLTLKWLHVLGAILLLGNVTVTGVWTLYLYRHWRDSAMPFRPIARAILWTDLLFTVGGGALLTATGLMMAQRAGFSLLETPWLFRGIVALGVATLAWLVILLPTQFRLERATESGEIRRLFLRWTLIGWADTAILFYGLWAMVTRDQPLAPIP